MSLCYDVAVPKGKWPSFGQMNAALQQGGYPLRILLQGDQTLDDPMSEFDGFLSFHVEFMGQFQEMEVYCGPYGPKGRDLEDSNELLESLGSDHRVKDGDHNMNIGFGSKITQEYWAPYAFLIGMLCTKFDGYLYEGQGGMIGGKDVGDMMIKEATSIVDNEKRKAAKEQSKAKAEADAALVAATAEKTKAAEQAAAKKGFPLWRTLAVIVVALLVAEFIDKNVYNFTGGAS